MRATFLLLVLCGCNPPPCDPCDSAPPDDSAPDSAPPADTADSEAPVLDEDGDGFTAPEDCNDLDPFVHPDALDVQNGADDNCDGERDVQLLSSVHTKLVGEGAGDWAGASVAGLGDLDGDGFEDLGVGAWYESSAGRDAGAVYVLFGPVERGVFSLAFSDVKITGEAEGDLVSRVENAGDMDGDGLGDVLVCAQEEDTAGNNAGAAYLLRGPLAGPWDLADAEAKLLGEAAGDGVMRAIRAGDMDGDGQLDLLIGAPGDASLGTMTGAAYVVTGPVAGILSLSDAHAKLTGQEQGDVAGAFLAAPGDLDHDGYDDVVIGDHNGNHTATHAGSAYLVYGPVAPGAGRALDAAGAVFYGPAAETKAGKVAEAGDLSGDGDTDWLSAAFGDNGGGTYVFGGVQSGELDRDDAFAILDLGVADAVGVGDVDDDGRDDLLVGTETGSFLLFGPLAGMVHEDAVDVFLPAEEADDYAGYRVAALGDTNGDGCDDFLIGAKGEDTGGDAAGAAYLVLGARRAGE